MRAKRTWPAQALALFLLIIVAIYALVFFTGDRSATPKLGIDLQGGTRVTLVPQGEDPTPEQLADARNIIEQRVNGMGCQRRQRGRRRQHAGDHRRRG
ncbi:preprotein translocase subunit SecD [Corynebacterium lipophiloflavum DSM 44291]|uniref:Preprotein translocase subunit SecD n=1 Tax=Corynebacterium lipophiloflavum (strain ATCC 700352 / DSM 44291 / CCUG 37336 / JCM 10383 / DMMZ 1944) TaxID=525263 RepID=C0XSQ1_CORLD|nr:preprotein translocase subunit SecD [Corynebacterium lipophiloflavum DSM 44291]